MITIIDKKEIKNKITKIMEEIGDLVSLAVLQSPSEPTAFEEHLKAAFREMGEAMGKLERGKA